MLLSVLWNHFRSLRSCLRFFYFRWGVILFFLVLSCSGYAETCSYLVEEHPYLTWSRIFKSTKLEVRSEPLYPDFLASTFVDTPDPNKECFFGEQIVVFYGFGCSGDEGNISLTIRYWNKEYEYYNFPLNYRHGYWIFRLINDEYWKKGGILAYKIELREKETVIKTWKHHLYVDLIEVSHQ